MERRPAKRDVCLQADVWSRFPDDLFINVMAFLPFRSLLRCRSICKSWNTLPLSRRFRQMRSSIGLEVMNHVQQHGRFGIADTTKGFNDDFVLLYSSPCENHQSLCVMQPSRLFAQGIPSLEGISCDRLTYHNVVDIVSDDGHDFTLFVQSNVREDPGIAPKFARTLHCYRSAMDSWSWSGLIQLKNPLDRLAALARHQDSYVLLVEHIYYDSSRIRWRRGSHRSYESHEVKRCIGFSTWETLPGNLPDFDDVQTSLFEHQGKLYLANVSFDQLSLWMYLEERPKWELVHQCQLACFKELGLGKVIPRKYPGAHHTGRVTGGVFYFGLVFCEMRMEVLESSRMMKYNLLTGELDAMSFEEIKASVITDRFCSSLQPFLYFGL